MIAEEAIIDLLPQFAKCKNYAEKLKFWHNHDLCENLYYEIPSNEYCWYPDEYSEGQYSKQLPVLSIAPFVKDEVQQFIVWALSVRTSMPSAPITAEKLCQDFQHRYYGIGRKTDRAEYLKECQSRIDLLVRDADWTSGAQRSMILEERRLDPILYKEFFCQLRSPFKPNLMSHIRVGEVELDWQVIDTYLYTKAQYNYAMFLEEFNPDSNEQFESIDLQSNPIQTINAKVPKRFIDLFTRNSNPDECINALRLIDTPVISEGGSWIGGKGSKSILVAWIKRLEDCDKIKFIPNRKHLVPLLNEHFPNLQLGSDARIFGEVNSIYDRYSEDFAALILR